MDEVRPITRFMGGSGKQDIVSKSACFQIQLNHFNDPRAHEKSSKQHAEWAPLGDPTSVLVGLTQL
eukprot:3944853-Karenia_brevis.AAC.1